MGILQNLDSIVAVVLFLAGMFWADYSKRGDRAGKQSMDVATIMSRLDAVERAAEEHGETARAVDRMQEQIVSMRSEMSTMREDFRRDLTSLREDFRRVLDEFTRPAAPRRGRANG